MEPQQYGQAGIHYAAALGRVDLCKLLVAAKADVNLRTSSEHMVSGMKTPLHFAATDGDVATCHFLLGCGAIPNTRDSDGRNPAQVSLNARADVRIVQC